MFNRRLRKFVLGIMLITAVTASSVPVSAAAVSGEAASVSSVQAVTEDDALTRESEQELNAETESASLSADAQASSGSDASSADPAGTTADSAVSGTESAANGTSSVSSGTESAATDSQTESSQSAVDSTADPAAADSTDSLSEAAVGAGTDSTASDSSDSEVIVGAGSLVEVMTEDEALLAARSFSDVSVSNFFYKAVAWALQYGIASGTDAASFGSEYSGTRAQIVTFLYHIAGSPAVTQKSAFTDVPQGSYYYDAVNWAVARGITSGTSATRFSPDAVCTRAQAVTFLYRAAGSPSVSGKMPFIDITTGQYFYNAVNWAYQNSITTGTDTFHFSQGASCMRSQIVTYLYLWINQAARAAKSSAGLDAGIATGVYAVRADANTAMCMTLASRSYSNSVNVSLGTYDSSDNLDYFIIENLGGGLYSIRNYVTDKYLHAANAGTADKTNVEQYKALSDNSEKWYILKGETSGSYYIRSALSDKFIEIYGAAPNDGANVDLYTVHCGSGQKWRLTKVSKTIFSKTTYADGVINLASALNQNYVVDISRSGLYNGKKAILYTKSNSTNQAFRLLSNGDGTYRIQAVHSQTRSLDMPNSSTSDGTQIQQYANNTSLAQKWVLASAGNGAYYILADGDKALTVDSSSAANSVSIVLKQYSGSASQKFYFSQAVLNNGSYYSQDGKDHYYLLNGSKASGRFLIDGNYYAFDSSYKPVIQGYFDSYYYDANGIGATTKSKYLTTKNGVTTLTAYLQNAMVPCGRSLYIWGGGWGDDASVIGVLDSVKSFFFSHADADYNYKKYRYQCGDGYDCSGFVAWVTYNTMNKTSGQDYMVYKSTAVASTYQQKGWVTLDKKTFYPGDIVSMDGHVWICLGTYSDNSVLLVHSSPRGCQISGTSGIAAEKAKYYMSKYYPEWPYEARTVSSSYLSYIHKGTWVTDGTGLLKDPDGVQKMSADQVMKLLFGE
jgi:hypothetical protein